MIPITRLTAVLANQPAGITTTGANSMMKPAR